MPLTPALARTLSHPAALALLTCATLAAAPRPAAAQFGRIKNAVAGKIAEKTAEKTVDKASEKATGRPASVPAPAFDENTLEITDATFDKTLKGLEAERAVYARLAKEREAAERTREAEMKAYAAKQAAYEQEMVAYERKRAEHQACVTKLGAEHQATFGAQSAKMNARMAQMSEADIERFEQRMQELQRKTQEAQQRGDRVAAAAYADTAMREMQQTTGIDFQEAAKAGAAANQANADLLTKCGQGPKEPVRPEAPGSAGEQDPREAVDAAVAKATGLKPAQYYVLRERIGAYAMAKGQFGAGNQWAFSGAELEVLKRRTATLPPQGSAAPDSYEYWSGQ